MKFIVITKVPDPRKGESGNLATAMGDVYIAQGRYPDELIVPIENVMGVAAIALRHPVFQVGEVIISNDDGREIPYPQRKPSKWDVTTETFQDLDVALARSKEVSDAQG